MDAFERLFFDHSKNKSCEFFPAPLAIFKLDSHCCLTEAVLIACNELYCTMKGQSQDELLGKKRQLLENFVESLTAEDKEKLSEGKEVHVQHKYIHHSGRKYLLKNYSKICRTDNDLFLVSCYFPQQDTELNIPNVMSSDPHRFPNIFFTGKLEDNYSSFQFSDLSKEGEFYLEKKDSAQTLDQHVAAQDLFLYAETLRKLSLSGRASVSLHLHLNNGMVTFCNIEFWKDPASDQRVLGVIHPQGNYNNLVRQHLDLVEKCSDWIWTATPEGNILTSNQGWKKIFYQQTENIIGKNVFDLFPNLAGKLHDDFFHPHSAFSKIEIIHQERAFDSEKLIEFNTTLLFSKHVLSGQRTIEAMTQMPMPHLLDQGENESHYGKESLTPTERNVLEEYNQHYSAKAVAEILNLSIHTVNNHLKSIRRKLNIKKGVSLKKILKSP